MCFVTPTSWNGWSLRMAVSTWTELICDSAAAGNMADVEVAHAGRDWPSGLQWQVCGEESGPGSWTIERIEPCSA